LLVRAALDHGLRAANLLVSINGALLPFAGIAGLVLPSMARLFARNSLLPRLFAWRATDRRAVERLIESTGSVIDARGVDLYARLVASPGHVAGALAMMANWDLQTIARGLPKLDIPLLLIAGARDRTVDPNAAQEVARLAPKARVIVLPELGHLAHEEAPRVVAARVRSAARAHGCLAGSQPMSG
jgi:magnesium chelatase accessory protein